MSDLDITDLHLPTIRSIVWRLGGESTSLKEKECTEDEHIKYLMEVVSALEGRAKYSSLKRFRKQVIKKIIASNISSIEKANLVEEIFEMELEV